MASVKPPPLPPRPRPPKNGPARMRQRLIAYLSRLSAELQGLSNRLATDREAFGLTREERDELETGLDQAWMGVTNHAPAAMPPEVQG